jgi:hypothetical protein
MFWEKSIGLRPLHQRYHPSEMEGEYTLLVDLVRCFVLLKRVISNGETVQFEIWLLLVTPSKNSPRKEPGCVAYATSDEINIYSCVKWSSKKPRAF